MGKGGRVVRRVIAVGYCVPSSSQAMPALLALVHYFNCMSCLTHMNISLAGGHPDETPIGWNNCPRL